MHALQRVQRSRSIGLSCAIATSNAPSQPASARQRARSAPETSRVAGSSAPLARAGREHRDGKRARRAPAPSAAPRRAGRRSAAAPPSGRRRSAPARARAARPPRAAPRSWASRARASADQPPFSRTLTKRIVRALPASSATSPSSRSSCVQATSTSPCAASAKPPSSLLAHHRAHRGAPASRARARAPRASSGIVPLHEHRNSVLSAMRHRCELRRRAAQSRSRRAARRPQSASGATRAASLRRAAARSAPAMPVPHRLAATVLAGRRPWASPERRRVAGGVERCGAPARACAASPARSGSGFE